MKYRKGSMLHGAALLTVTGAISQLVGFVYRILLSRMIGAENMGLYQLILPVYAVVMSIISVGLTSAVSRLSAEYGALGNTRAIHALLRQCVTMLLVLFTGAALVLVPFCDPISVSLLGDARTQLGLLLLLPCMLLTGIENLHKFYFYGRNDVRPPAFMELLEQAVRTAAVLALLMLFPVRSDEITVGLIVAGMTICEFVSVVGLVRLYRRDNQENRLQGPGVPAAELRGKVVGIAFPVGITSLMGNLMTSANTVLIPQRLILSGVSVSEAMSAFGVLFGMSIPLMMLPGAFISALCLTLLPRLAESQALHRKEDIRRSVSRAVAATSMIVLPSMAFLILFGPALGNALFREDSVGKYIGIMAPGVFFAFQQSVTGSALNGLGKHRAAAAVSIASDVIQLGFTYFGTAIPGVGMNGFIAGFIVSSVFGFGLNLFFLARETGMTVDLTGWLVSPGLAALSMGLAMRLVTECFGGGFPAAVCGTAAGLIVYLVLLRLQGVRLELRRLGDVFRPSEH